MGLNNSSGRLDIRATNHTLAKVSLRLTRRMAPKGDDGRVRQARPGKENMKKLFAALVFALFAFFATAAIAQGPFTLRADVPFSFSVGGHHYSAGFYELRSINSSTVQLVNMETGEASLIKLTVSEQATMWNITPPRLRFVVSAESFYLVSLVDGYGNGWQVPVTSQ